MSTQQNTFTYNMFGIQGKPCPDKPMWLLFNAFRERQGCFTLVFIYNGEIIDEAKTPRELGIPDGTTITSFDLPLL